MKKFLIVLCVIWVGFIFYNSMNPGYVSHEKSFAIVNFLRNGKAKIEKIDNAKNGQNKSSSVKKIDTHTLPDTKRDSILDTIVRKNAHAFEYFVLAVIISSILFWYGIKGKNALIYIMFMCLLCAVLDEFSQKFSIKRTSSVGDVLIDFAGSLIGILIFYIVYYSRDSHHSKKIKEI